MIYLMIRIGYERANSLTETHSREPQAIAAVEANVRQR